MKLSNQNKLKTVGNRKLSPFLFKTIQQFPQKMFKLLKFGLEEDFKLLLKFPPWSKQETTSIMFMLSWICKQKS